MNTFRFVMTAGDDTVFTDGAADHFVGQSVPVNVRNQHGDVVQDFGVHVVTAATLIDGGHAVELTVTSVEDQTTIKPLSSS